MNRKGLHGGDIYSFDSEKQEKILDYSSNINPLGVGVKLEEAIIKNFHLLERYPDVNYLELRENIGRFNGVNLENIVVGNGAVEVLFLYMKALSPKSAMIVSPTFAEYERALKNIDCQLTYHELYEKDNFKLDIDRLVGELRDEELVVLCNPNNPTGNLIPLAQIEELNRKLKERSTKLFIDECFIEFIEGWEEISASLLKSKNIFILRAFTKFFGIPGLRLGYGITFDRELQKKIGEIREPWSINSFAELAGKILPWDRGYIEETYEWINSEKRWFYNELSKNRNLKVYETETNFILIKLLTMNSEEFKMKMLEEDILIRDASNFRFLDNSFIRLAIKNRENNERVIKKIQEVIGMEAILIVGHGSRSAEARLDFENVIKMVKEKLSEEVVKGAHMENATPDIPTVIEDILREQPETKTIKVVPYFLYSGIHIREDIPEILDEMRAKHPEIEFKLGNAIGAHRSMADILIERISEI